MMIIVLVIDRNSQTTYTKENEERCQKMFVVQRVQKYVCLNYKYIFVCAELKPLLLFLLASKTYIA